MKELNVLYTVNRKFVDTLLVSIVSLLKNANITKINFHIVTSGFLDEDYRKINNILPDNINIEYYPLEDYNIKSYGIPDWRGSQIANARLFFQDILAKNMDMIDNLLYLDSDTIVVGDLNSLEKYNKEIVGAIKDHSRYGYIRKLGLDKYYNSGVLYINTNQWLENDCQNKLIDTLENNDIKMVYPDQDLVNLSLGDMITVMPQEYNMGPVSYLYKEESIFEKIFFNNKVRQVDITEINNAKRNPKILHSYGFINIKPWSNNSVNPYNEEFLKYILSIDSSYKLEEIEGFKRIFANNVNLVRLSFLLKSIIPVSLELKAEKVLKMKK